MPRFSANLSMLFCEWDFLDRFNAAARAGFQAVEYMGPYEYEPESIVAQLRMNELSQVLFNLPAGDWGKGERGIAALPDRIDEFRQGVDTAIAYAKALGCPQVNCLAGIVPPNVERRVLRDTFVENLKFASERLKSAGVRLLIEPINTIDIPDFFLSGTKQALEIIDRVGSDNLYLQYDIYHMQIMEGNLAQTIEQNLKKIAHIQLADNPGRHEPGTGEVNFRFLCEHLDRIGYQGWLGAEYKPSGDTATGLGWLKQMA